MSCGLSSETYSKFKLRDIAIIIRRGGGLRNELQRGSYYVVPPLPPFAKALLVHPPLDFLIIFTTPPPLPPTPNIM